MHKAAYFARTKPRDQFTARMVPFSFGTNTAQDGSPNKEPPAPAMLNWAQIASSYHG